MVTVVLEWADGLARRDNIANASSFYDNNGFYAFLAGQRKPDGSGFTYRALLYIGQAYDQTLRQRIAQDHEGADDCLHSNLKQGEEVLVMAARILKCSSSRITAQLFNDIECCLIFTNQPLCNTQCKESYTGSEISITNTGDYKPLKPASNCS